MPLGSLFIFARPASAARAKCQRDIQSLARAITVITTCWPGCLVSTALEIVGRLDRLAIDGHDQVGGGPIDRGILVTNGP